MTLWWRFRVGLLWISPFREFLWSLLELFFRVLLWSSPMDPSVRALLRGSPVDLSPEFCEVLLWNQFLWKQFLVERSAILQSQHSRQLWLRLRNRFWSVKKINQRPLWHCCQCENALLINNRAGWFAQQCIIYSNTLITGHTIICESQDLKSHSLSCSLLLCQRISGSSMHSPGSDVWCRGWIRWNDAASGPAQTVRTGQQY